MSITKQKINNVKISKIPLDEIPPDKIKGSELFPQLYNNIFICARKASGKTTVISSIIQQTTDKRTTVLVFSSTHHQDKAWEHIKGYLEYKKIPNQFFDSLEQLPVVIAEIKAIEAYDDDEQEETPEQVKTRETAWQDKEVRRILGQKDEEEERKKERAPKKLTPAFLCIFDDISDELKSKALDQLLKTNRHLHSRIIISTQWVNDLLPSSRRQIQTYLLFGGLSDAKLDQIYVNADLHITFKRFKELYIEATREKYNFFYIDSDRSEYRKNFNEKYNA